MKTMYLLKKKVCLLLAFLSCTLLMAQDKTTVSATNEDISKHLDLEAVASILGDSKDLEDFEYKLNDPKTKISNLDLNEDNEVDYLRVVETTEKETHLIAIQAVIGENLYQDVATVEVEKDDKGVTQVQVVGDVYVYGENYIIEPLYVYRPVIYTWLWRPFYKPYRSAFYWGVYPRHFRYWRPLHRNTYRRNVHVHVNVRHTYRRTAVRRSRVAVRVHRTSRRTAAVTRYPHRSYSARRGVVVKTTGTKKRVVGVKGKKARKAKVVKKKKVRKARRNRS